MLREFYEDDLNSGVNSIEERAELYKKLKLRFFDWKFNLGMQDKWWKCTCIY